MRWTREHRKDVQGLRALAVVAVVLYHADLGLHGGFVGVDVFFVISGFVIAGSLQREWMASGSIDVIGFALRRVRRLLPAFTAMVGTVMVLGGFLAPLGGHEALARTGLAAAVFNANGHLAAQTTGYFDNGPELNPLLHTWSLSVEEQFYVVFPVGMLGIWCLSRRYFPRREAFAVWVVVGTVGVASLARSLWYTYESGLGSRWAFYLAAPRAWEFLAGALLALAAPALRLVPARLLSVAQVAGLAAIVGSMAAFSSSTVFPGIAALVPVAGTVLVIAGGSVATGRVTAALASRGAGWIGDRSYGWYLWHWPAIVFTRAWWPDVGAALIIAVALASISLADLSYRYIEQPIRTARAVAPARTLVMLAAGVAVAAGLSSALITANTAIVDERTAELGPHLGTAGCDRAGLDLANLPPDCTFGPGGSNHLVLIGDSQAGQLVEGVLAAVDGTDTSVSIATQSGCPFVDLWISSPHADGGSCGRFVSDGVAELVERRPNRVVVASGSSIWLNNERPLYDPATRRPVKTVEERTAAWTAGLDRIVAPLVEVGIEVVVVLPIPRFPDWSPQDCATVLVLRRSERCSPSMTRADALAATRAARQVEMTVAARYDLVTVDPFDVMCLVECRTYDDGWTMRDGSHISVAMSEQMAGLLSSALRTRPAVLREVSADAPHSAVGAFFD